jgi:hypothetical protein
VYWYTSLPPASTNHKPIVQIRTTPKKIKKQTARKRRNRGEKGIYTWGLDDPRLVGLGGIAVPLPVGQALHHLTAARRTPMDKPR